MRVSQDLHFSASVLLQLTATHNNNSRIISSFSSLPQGKEIGRSPDQGVEVREREEGKKREGAGQVSGYLRLVSCCRHLRGEWTGMRTAGRNERMRVWQTASHKKRKILQLTAHSTWPAAVAMMWPNNWDTHSLTTHSTWSWNDMTGAKGCSLSHNRLMARQTLVLILLILAGKTLSSSSSRYPVTTAPLIPIHTQHRVRVRERIGLPNSWPEVTWVE